MREKQSGIDDKPLVVEAYSGATVEGDSKPYVSVWARHGDGPTTRVFLSASDATDASKIVHALLNAGLKFNDPVLIKRAVPTALKSVSWQPTRVAVRSGWHEKQFVYDGIVYGQSTASSLFVHQDLVGRSRRVSPSRNDELMFYLDKVGAKSDFLVFATLVAFAQPLLGMLPSPERAVIYIWGESRTGKTTLATLINALSRPPSDRELFSFDATDRAFEEMLQGCSDNVAVFDELTVIQDTEIDRKLTPFIYMAANGRGKSRSKGANFPNLRWRTTTIVTGEKDQSAYRERYRGSGQDARFIVLPVPARSDGGIWTAPMPLKKREMNIRKLDLLCRAYTGHSYLEWIRYLVERYDDVKLRFEANVEKHIHNLVGEDADGVTRARARRYAQIIAAGDELINHGTVEWDSSLPLEAVQRLYKADVVPVISVANVPSDTRTPAIEILAQIGRGAIPFHEGDEESEGRSAYRCKWMGEEFVMIKRDHLSEFISGSPSKVANAFKAAGASKSSGTSPFFQYGKARERYLRVSLVQLNRLAERP